MSTSNPTSPRPDAASIRHRLRTLAQHLRPRRPAPTSPTPPIPPTTFHPFPRLPPEIRAQIWCASLPVLASSLRLYDPRCWTHQRLLPEDADGDPDAWRMTYDHTQLRAQPVSVPPAFVCHEAHAVAAAWLREHDRVCYDPRRGFFRPFDPECDTLYVPRRLFRTFRKGYAWPWGWGLRLRAPTWREVLRLRYEFWVQTEGRIRHVAVDREVLCRYEAGMFDALMDVCGGVGDGGMEVLLLVLNAKRRAKVDEQWLRKMDLIVFLWDEETQAFSPGWGKEERRGTEGGPSQDPKNEA